MTPRDAGYVRCPRCATWRPTCTVAESEGVCLDVAWCSAQAGAGLGRLDADTGDSAGNLPGRPVPRLPFSPDSEGLPDDAWTKGSIP